MALKQCEVMWFVTDVVAQRGRYRSSEIGKLKELDEVVICSGQKNEIFTKRFFVKCLLHRNVMDVVSRA